MRAVIATATVSADHTLTARVPVDVPPGTHTVVVVLGQPPAAGHQGGARALTPHPVGPASGGETYRREDLYGDDGR